MPEQKTFRNYMHLKFFLESILEKPVDLVIPTAIKPALQPYILEQVLYAEDF